MMTDTIGWIVRTETAGHHRYWKVGETDSDRAAMIARYTASADVATAVTRIPPHTSPTLSVSPGVVTEVVWQSTPVPNTSEQFELEDQVGTREVALGKVTFDIVVPEEGVRHAEGCYQIHGGNWHVYYLTNWHDGASWTGAPVIRSTAIFQSGLSGVSGIVPADWPLNRKTI